MKIFKGYFYVNTGYVGCTKKEDFEIEVEDGNSGTEQLEDAFQDFLGNVDMGWVIENEEILND